LFGFLYDVRFDPLTRLVVPGSFSTYAYVDAVPDAQGNPIPYLIGTAAVTTVPLPAALPLLAAAIAGLGLLGSMRRRAA
jgi:hypothetical protein